MIEFSKTFRVLRMGLGREASLPQTPTLEGEIEWFFQFRRKTKNLQTVDSSFHDLSDVT